MSYDAWKAAALLDDRRSGMERWKREDRTHLYDYKVIRRRLDELVDVRASEDPHRLVYYLNEGVHGNMGGMGAPALYAQAKFGTKQLVSDYVAEVATALLQLEQLDERDVSFKEKLALLRRLSLCFGRSALMLSGAGSQGPFHMGVVKALLEQGLLPGVVSGASAGSVVAAIAGTYRADALRDLLTLDRYSSAFELVAETEGVGRARKPLKVADLKATIEASIPDLTFVEAFEETGIYINISVAPAEVQQRSRLLNAITSPNALIRDAVLASCAIPGVFPPVTLAAKDATGRRKAYVPSRQWVDGSITGDLPSRRLSRLYGVNHFITSQANPLVLWALPDPHAGDNPLLQLSGIYQAAAREWLRAVYPLAMDAVRYFYPLNVLTRMMFGVMTQEYTADINIMPRRRVMDPQVLLSALSSEEVYGLVVEGERATWPKIEMIRVCTEISRTIDAILRRMEARLLGGDVADGVGDALRAGDAAVA